MLPIANCLCCVMSIVIQIQEENDLRACYWTFFCKYPLPPQIADLKGMIIVKKQKAFCSVLQISNAVNSTRKYFNFLKCKKNTDIWISIIMFLIHRRSTFFISTMFLESDIPIFKTLNVKTNHMVSLKHQPWGYLHFFYCLVFAKI